MKATVPISAQIITLIQTEDWPVGTHLRAQPLADRLRVSRSPVNEALQLLEDKGILRRERNRGYFLNRGAGDIPAELLQEVGMSEADASVTAYFKIAEDRLQGRLPDTFSEASLKARYQLTPAQLTAVLTRIAQEGWAERKPGYGWAFSSMLTTPDSLLQSYRLRLALEPAALLEPGYRLDPQVLQRCRAAEQQLLDGGIGSATADELHERGVYFHESLVEASGNAFFIDTIRRVTGCAACCPTARCATANAMSSTATSTWRCCNCWSASATRKRRRPCARTWAAPCATLAVSATSCSRARHPNRLLPPMSDIYTHL